MASSGKDVQSKLNEIVPDDILQYMDGLSRNRGGVTEGIIYTYVSKMVESLQDVKMISSYV